MPPARSKVTEPAAAAAPHCLPAFERWMQSYPLASAWISKKLGGQDNLYDAVADAGGFLVVEDFLPVNIATGIESLLRRCVSIISRQLDRPLTPACQPAAQRVEHYGGARRHPQQQHQACVSKVIRVSAPPWSLSHAFRSSKGAVSPKAAAAAALKLPGATSETAAAAVASVKLLPLVFRLFSILNPEDFHTFSAAK
jgi:hypothetical protein